MTADHNTETQTELQLIDGCLADLGTLFRRHEAETLTEEDGLALMNRMRRRLKALRSNRLADAGEELELTDAGAAYAAATQVARHPNLQALLRRVPRLMTARNLADHPGVTRARFHGPFAAIDGDRP